MEIKIKANKPVLLGTIAAIILVGTVVLILINKGNPVGASSNIYNESLDVYNMIDKAYDEGRLLNKVERIKVEEYREMAEEWKDKIADSNEFTKTNEIDLRIMTDIEIMANWYEFQSETELFQEKSADNFIEYYNNSKKSLGLE